MNENEISKSIIGFFSCFAQTFANFAVRKGLIISLFMFLILITTTVKVQGQSDKLSENIVEIAEELAADDSDPEAVTTFVDKLNELTENPVKINSSSETEISRLFFLSDFQVKALAEYTHSSGQVVSVYEIAAIPGFDRETVEMIIPFITLENKLVIDSDSVRWRNALISNFSLKSGNNNSAYLGTLWRILTKYKFTAGGFSGGMTMEKDPGEKLLSGTPPVPDFLSAYLAYKGRGVIKRIIVGDYSARFGQGSNLNTGIRRGVSLTTPGYMSACDETIPYTSTEENRFLRGIAAEFSLRSLGISIYFSKNFSDATINTPSNTMNNFVESLYPGGLHNTPSLLKKKDVVSIVSYGISCSYNFNNLKVGLAWTENRLSLPILVTVIDPENIYSFTGLRNSLYTIYYNSFIRKILLFGELSLNDNKRIALIQGMSFRPSDRLSVNLLFRNYSAGYTTFYGQGPGAGSKTSNECGILGNFTFEAARHLFISAGCDVYNFPWLKYRCSAPSRGVKKELKVRYLPTDKLIFDASYDYRLSMADSAEGHGIPAQKTLITSSIKASARYSVNSNLTLGTRADFKKADLSGSKGMMLFQELSYRFPKIPVTIWARFCLFNTTGWDSRIYTYENDLLYSFSIPALSGEGSRSYFMVKWSVSDRAELRIKYGITSLISNDKTSPDTDEIKMQFRVAF